VSSVSIASGVCVRKSNIIRSIYQLGIQIEYQKHNFSAGRTKKKYNFFLIGGVKIVMKMKKKRYK
jgi:phage regulator Rha-like protein